MLKQAGISSGVSRKSLRARRRSQPSAPEPAPPAALHPAAAPSPALKIGNDSAAERRLLELADKIRVCTRCPLHLSRKIAVPGEGNSKSRVMVIGEAPGGKEDETGQPFVGSAGRYFDHVLKGTGLSRGDFFLTNIVKCRPPSNRTPKTDEVQTCTSLYLFEQMALIQPRLVLLLGSLAVKTLLGLKTVEEARGKVVQQHGRSYIASYHPAVRFYREDLAAKIKEDFALFRSELKKLPALSFPEQPKNEHQH